MNTSDNSFFALVAHKIAPFQFDLGVGAVNASIRDQIVRAQMVVRALDKLQKDTPEHLRRKGALLICGAGIAGLAAADEARRKEMDFVLIDKSRFPSGALSGDGNRYLSPTMYEWPSSIVDEHEHPLQDLSFLAGDAGVGFKLPFGEPVRIAKLRAHIKKEMASRLKKWEDDAATPSAIHIYLPNTQIAQASKVALQELLDSQKNGGPVGDLSSIELVTMDKARENIVDTRKIECSYIVFAGGFSAEKTEYAGMTFETPPFWQKDKLTNRYFGIPKQKTRVSAFIAGAGDGAIQDALRCLIKKEVAHPTAIWERIVDGVTFAVPETGGTGEKLKHESLEAILTEILSLDNYATVAFMWSGEKKVFECVDKAHAALCRNLLALGPGIRENIRAILRDDVEEVHVQRNREFFTRCYPLNRFLIHLLHKVLDEKMTLPSGRPAPILTFDHGDPKGATESGAGLCWKGKTYHIAVIRTGARDEHHQTVGLTGVDPARIGFGRMPPPFMPAKVA
jgi:hypothetical protein